MVVSSGPVASELPLVLIARKKISGEERDTDLSSEHSLWSFCLTNRVDGLLDLGRGEVNCLTKAAAISPLRVRDLEDKVMG